MKHDLENIRAELSHYDVDMESRPDGSILLTVGNNGRQLVRVIDESCSAQEVVRLIHFDMTLDRDPESINEAVKHSCSTQLPTYSREPIFRTRCARLWNSRKLTDR